MKVLYCALAIDMDRAHGGATHVTEVTNGLTALGHEVWVVAAGRQRRGGTPGSRRTRVTTPPALAWSMTPRVCRIVQVWRPDVVMERYYTFAGGGIVAAHGAGIPSLLEVNAPVVDPPGSRKDRVDRLSGRALTRWATLQCQWATRIVTPLATTVPAEARSKVVALHWGANTERFDPTHYPEGSEAIARLRSCYGIAAGAPVIGFVGSFRPWHGAADAVRAFRTVRGTIPDARLLLVGDGPERAALESLVAGEGITGVTFAGAVPYAEVPAHLAVCTVAVAPFAPRMHAPLRHFGFYWSPLKVFEAMAMGVPIVTTAVAPLPDVVGDAGICVPEGEPVALAQVLIGLLHDRERRDAMGATGRARVVSEYSWQAHCRHLDALLREMVG